ncbi:MAG: hypothetical protein RSA29_14700 [Clostridium sp.]|uniref:hypothetical protein n=1 Tax=Clostridium sp. TaxID=1506 RepID=UPI0032172732
MKKFTGLFLIFLFLTFIAIGLKPAFAATNNFKEGVYKLSDFIPSRNNVYVFSNISSTDKIQMIIVDENQTIHQSIILSPNSEKHITLPILPNYTVTFLGKGEMYFYPAESK